jgi:hypothetical protein
MYIHNLVECSVVDPDPVRSETLSRIRIRKKSSEQRRIQNEYDVNSSE